MKVVTHARGGDDADRAYDAAVARLNAEVERLRKPFAWIEPPSWGEAGEPRSTVTQEQFMAAVEQAQEHIRAGDIFQVVLAHRMSAEVSQPPFEGYRALRVTNPSPYMYFLRLGDFSIVGSSPEVLVRRTDSLVEVRPGITPIDAVRATFPAGTVSGAPKVRAMEIIDALEPVRRGIYAGAVGHFDYHGNLDLAITIRTLVYANGRAYWGVGAGIVADSDPREEWEETMNKGRALWLAVQRAERGTR
jgi:anthranilate/para-aminobenzoate synthase component I